MGLIFERRERFDCSFVYLLLLLTVLCILFVWLLFFIRDELHKKVDKSKSESCEMAATLELQKSQSVKVRSQGQAQLFHLPKKKKPMSSVC